MRAAATSRCIAFAAAVAAGCGDDPPPEPELVARSEATRPEWVGSLAPLHSRCTQEDAQMVCVGASSRASSEDAALTEARDAAVEGEAFVAFVRIHLSVEAFEQLRSAYTTRYEALGAEVVDFFPGGAWRHRHIVDGATIVALGRGDLWEFGLAEGYVVLSVQDRPIAGGAAFARIAHPTPKYWPDDPNQRPAVRRR